jgi:hypothetical protein
MNRCGTIGSLAVAGALSLLFTSGCRSLPPIPPADLTAPGWNVRHGQAVWRPNQRRPELAGELLVATHTNGDYLVEFTKTPFALASARQSGGTWRAEFGPGYRTWQGRGHGPRLIGWFELPRVLAGEKPSSAWRFTQANATWRLENWHTGERLEGTFPP